MAYALEEDGQRCHGNNKNINQERRIKENKAHRNKEMRINAEERK